jgi:mono/diheme cytochrome c family protein
LWCADLRLGGTLALRIAEETLRPGQLVWLPIALALVPAPPPASAEEEPDADAARQHEGYGLYQELCAECHGVRADGRGTRAGEFSPRPPDLRHLRGPAGGAVRVEDLVRVIDGRRTLRAHGASGMPVWGWELVADVPDPEIRERARLQLVHTLAEYLIAIQEPPPTGAGESPAPSAD